MEKYKMKSIILILLTVFLSSPCFSEEWVVKLKHLDWGANAQGRGLTLPVEEINELVTAVGMIEIHPMFAQMEDSLVTIAEMEGAFFYPDDLPAIKKTSREDISQSDWQFVFSGDYGEEGKFITQVKPFVRLKKMEQEGIKSIAQAGAEWGNPEIVYPSGFAGIPFGASSYLSSKGSLAKFGPNGGGGAGAYQAQFFLWEQGSVSEEQIQQIISAMREGVKVIPLYPEEGFNSADIVQYHNKRVLSEDVVEFIKGTMKNPTLENGIAYQLQEQLGPAETLVGVRAFSDYSLLENGEDTEKRFAVIKGLGNSSFGLDTWSVYGEADTVKEYGMRGFSSGIKDYSSMKGMMLIGPNGGGGAGAYINW